MKAPPQIAAPLDTGAPTPAVSVVIPTYEPERFLVGTLKSVLAQDPGPAQMQIAIVDDGSTRVRARDLLAEVAPAARIEYYEHTERLGLAGNWNRAIAHARGEFVHLLHQDDTVRLGFYARMLSGMHTSPRIGMGFCRHAFIDEGDRVERISHRERLLAGVLPRWLDRISERQRVQCPAAIVRRHVYETLGGFRGELRYALDWEMWVRVASAYEVWYEPRVLADYRRHRDTETSRLEATDSTSADMMSAIALISMYLPLERRIRLQQRAYLRLVRLQAKRAAAMLDAESPQRAEKQLENAQAVLEKLSEGFNKRWLRSRLVLLKRRLQNQTSRDSA